MAELLFDSLDYARQLESAGFTRQQAEVQASMMTRIIEERMATKRDLKELEMRLTIRMGGMLCVAVGVLAAIIKLG